MEYDAVRNELRAEFRLRDSSRLIGRLLIPDAGTFAPDMTRVGSSNCQSAKFYAANAKSTIRIDNLKLFITSGRPFVVDLSDGSGEATLAFGNRQLAALDGTVWEDTDGNSQQGSGEPGVAGQAVYIDVNGNGRADPAEPQTLTDESGHYRFTRLRPGAHIVALTLPDSYEPTFPPVRDWKQFRGQWYALTRIHGPWELCETDARAAGGHLVTINDAEENTWLTEQYRNEVLPHRSSDKLSAAVWIGLHRHNEQWVWSNGETPGFHAGWWNREPYLGAGTDHVSLLTAEARRAVWNNIYGRPSIAGDYPRGVIELPTGRQSRSHQPNAIVLESGQPVHSVDFGISRSRP